MTTDKSRPVVLTTRETEAEAALLAVALEEEGLEAMITGGFTSGFRAEAPGQVRILVHEKDLERAMRVMQAFDSHTD